jgi:formylmethanofuran dehydrogenase subunit E
MGLPLLRPGGRMGATSIGPVVVCVRGPSRSGKTTMVRGLVERLSPDGLRIGYAKRTHHALDLPEKASGRVWAAAPAAMVIEAPDRVQLTFAPGDGSAAGLVRRLPTEIDLVLLETHSPEPYPTLRSELLGPAPGEETIGTWSLSEVDAALDRAEAAVRELLPANLTVDRALRAARELHGGHACAGLILGTRLALFAGDLLGIDLPDRRKRLTVQIEIDRCAADAIAAVAGCRPGKRTLRFVDYGKLAATFWDFETGRAVRVAARGDLRDRVGEHGPKRHEAQSAAYLTWPAEDLFVASEVQEPVSSLDLPGPPVRRVNCVACGEEVADGREVASEAGPTCRPCARVS